MIARVLAVAAAALAAASTGALAAAAPAPILAAPGIEGVRVADTGERLVLDVRVSHAPISATARGRLHRHAADRLSLVRLRVRGPGGGVVAGGSARQGILLGAGARRAPAARITLTGADAARVRAAASAGAAAIEVRAADRIVRDGERRPRANRGARRTLPLGDPSGWASTAPDLAPPRCERATSAATRDLVTRIAVRCQGADRLAIASGLRRGTARVVRTGDGRAVIDVRPRPGVTGPDRVVVSASGPGGTTRVVRPIAVRQPVMRALGDSVTAGFGFMGDGTPMSILQLPSCIPPTPGNDRCSSNSSNGPGTGGGPSYAPDYGLSNGVAWPAQFAASRGLSGATSFQNLAVSGSTPADWDTGGQLSGTLAEIVADEPNLTVMTLGANPLLDSFLFGGGLRCELTLSEAEFKACVEGFIQRNQLVSRVGSVIDQLLEAPSNHVVVSQYHQAIPSSSVFSVSSLRIMDELLNGAVATAVQSRADFGTRVFLMTPPLFAVGVPPGDELCPGPGQRPLVDGVSRQSHASQDELAVLDFSSFCGSTDYWIISADTGIHPSRAGHAQFAAALAQVVEQNDLLPPPQ